MVNQNLLFANPVAVVSVDTAVILRGEKLADAVTERTNESDTQRPACISLEIDTRRDAIGDDNLTVTAEGVLVINGHSAVVEKDWGKVMVGKQRRRAHFSTTLGVYREKALYCG